MHVQVRHPLLLDLLRGNHSPLPSLATLSAQDWNAILDNGIEHRLEPLLFRNLNASGLLPVLPTSTRERLKRRVTGLAARNLLVTRELATILQSFAERELPVAPIRGPALAERLYGTVGDRATDDLDLLVRRQDLPAVEATLRELGYDEVEHRRGFAKQFSYASEFFHRDHGMLVEPHWTLAYPPLVERMDMEVVWKRCVPRTVLGIPAWGLSPTDEVLHLCAHLVHRGDQAPLLWYFELDQLIRQYGEGIDWNDLEETAERTGQLWLVANVLQSVSRLFGTPAPSGICWTRDCSDGPGRSRAMDRWLMQSQLSGREEFATLMSLPGWRAKIKYALGLLLPSPAFMRQRYGLSSTAGLCVYYPLRVLTFLWEGLKGLGFRARLSRSLPTGRSTKFPALTSAARNPHRFASFRLR